MTNITVIPRFQKKWRTPFLCFPASRETVADILKKEYGFETFDLGEIAPTLFMADISRLAKEDEFEPLEVCRLSAADKILFDLALDHIENCRRQLYNLLGSHVSVIIDRPVGTRHPKRPHIVYPINYGYLENILSADGEGADVYVLGSQEPMKRADGKVIAIVHRIDDIEDKLVISTDESARFSAKQIQAEIDFQEQAYVYTVEIAE